MLCCSISRCSFRRFLRRISKIQRQRKKSAIPIRPRVHDIPLSSLILSHGPLADSPRRWEDSASRARPPQALTNLPTSPQLRRLSKTFYYESDRNTYPADSYRLDRESLNRGVELGHPQGPTRQRFTVAAIPGLRQAHPKRATTVTLRSTTETMRRRVRLSLPVRLPHECRCHAHEHSIPGVETSK